MSIILQHLHAPYIYMGPNVFLFTLSILNSTIKINDKNNLDISAIYKFHDLQKTEFIDDLKLYLDSKKKLKKIIFWWMIVVLIC